MRDPSSSFSSISWPLWDSSAVVFSSLGASDEASFIAERYPAGAKLSTRRNIVNKGRDKQENFELMTRNTNDP